MIVREVLQISVLMWDINSPFSCQYGLTNGACIHWKSSQTLWMNAAFSSSERISRSSWWSEGEHSDILPFHKTHTNRRTLIGGCVNYQAPESHNSSSISRTFALPLHLQVLFFSSGSSGSLARSSSQLPHFQLSSSTNPAAPACLTQLSFVRRS